MVGGGGGDSHKMPYISLTSLTHPQRRQSRAFSLAHLYGIFIFNLTLL